MKASYYGHSCVGVEIEGKHLLFDPFISPNPAASHIDIEAIPADYIFLTHGHEDHIADAEAIAKRTGATLITGYEVGLWFGKKGIENLHSMNPGGSAPFEFGKVTMTNAIHSSSLPDGTYGGHPGGFIVESEAEGSFYMAGDTALFSDMKLIGERFDLRWAGLPIGDNYTMGATDAATAAQWVGTERVLGLHYNTFPPIEIDTAKARNSFRAADVSLLLPAIGDELVL